MKLLEYLDRRDERRLRRPNKPLRDIRQIIGAGFLLGYYVMVWHFANSEIPKANLDLIRDAMLTLGPPVGLIVGAMFRSDARDEQATRNTGEAWKAVRDVANATGAPGNGDPNALRTGDTVELNKGEQS